ncbi:MAG: Tyrosine--tRNA ligase 1 [candidate division WS2 bacterium]|uniref:Tyrosine--tRNA ligase n=1 Tax=Psychracetigena formicireducens TaxID=2986056 RepID=A0A9E2BK02_PSYF1|nr:Tyrosine--tRNA ligase 1 [Candidatus Psychracetigena formicireducens]MBT9144504.1 Tyrosine--tRNA ligase 1 [Candidatus Psychracetigena formicireducens]
MSVFDELKWRGLIYDSTEGLEEAIATNNFTIYVGIDPTASSLHVGHLLPILVMSRLQKFGHKPIIVVGGGTGLIGDPSGKSEERPLLSTDIVQQNLENIRKQLSPFLDFNSKTNPATIVNNADWLTKTSLLEFLRTVGKYFTVNYMLAKESVKRRIDLDDGISFTEFSYMLAQSYDYLVLYEQFGCKLQIGGSDQWGNITAGIDLIRKKKGDKVFGLVLPLLTTSNGVKFGKTGMGTIWLSPELTSPFKFYQCWINVEDADVIKYLKYFTFLNAEEINNYKDSLEKYPEKREAQKRLAKEITTMVHSTKELEKAKRATEVLFGGNIQGLKVDEILEIFVDVPSLEVSKQKLLNELSLLVDFCVYSGITVSKNEAKRLVRNNGLYLNNNKIDDEYYRITENDIVGDCLLVLRKGTREYKLVKIVK